MLPIILILVPDLPQLTPQFLKNGTRRGVWEWGTVQFTASQERTEKESWYQVMVADPPRLSLEVWMYTFI